MGIALGCPLLRRDGHPDVDVSRGETIPVDTPHDQLEVEAERFQGPEKRLLGQAKVQQRRHEHIARSAGECIEMEDFFDHVGTQASRRKGVKPGTLRRLMNFRGGSSRRPAAPKGFPAPAKGD
jgi:hypothetical protein